MEMDVGFEQNDSFDRFDNPFVHPAILHASEGRITSGAISLVEHGGYHLPFETHRSLVALNAKVVRFWAHGNGPVGGAFWDPENRFERNEDDFKSALDLLAKDAHADLLLWPYFPLQAREFTWLKDWVQDRFAIDAEAILVSRQYERAFLNCSNEVGAANDLGLTLSRNKSKTLGRQRRNLEAIGLVEFVSTNNHGVHDTSRPDFVHGDTALAEFLAVEASGWKGRKGTALKSDDFLHEFVSAFMPRMLAEGRVQIDLMRLDGKCISGLISFRAGQGMFTWKTGMDEHYQRYSPGVQILLEVSRTALADPSVDYVDSLADAGHPVVEALWGGRRSVGFLFVPLNGYGRIAGHSLKAGYAAKERLRYLAKRALGRV